VHRGASAASSVVGLHSPADAHGVVAECTHSLTLASFLACICSAAHSSRRSSISRTDTRALHQHAAPIAPFAASVSGLTRVAAHSTLFSAHPSCRASEPLRPIFARCVHSGNSSHAEQPAKGGTEGAATVLHDVFLSQQEIDERSTAGMSRVFNKQVYMTTKRYTDETPTDTTGMATSPHASQRRRDQEVRRSDARTRTKMQMHVRVQHSHRVYMCTHEDRASCEG
jgi:hypothetical protein